MTGGSTIRDRATKVLEALQGGPFSRGLPLVAIAARVALLYKKCITVAEL